jgi:uncharacterized membrane protein YphA (DoxX/SURF4 family)
MKIKYLCWIAIACRVILGAMFIYAGIGKIADLHQFADNIHAFQLIPKELVSLITIGLPVFEIVLGGLLILGIQRRACSLMVTVLCLIFLVALVQAYMRGLNVDCGCFGESKFGSASIGSAIVRDVAFLVLASFFFYYEYFKKNSDRKTLLPDSTTQ